MSDIADEVTGNHLAEVVSSFDNRAVGYDDSEMHRGVARAVADFISLTAVHTVLDVATGTGLVLRELLARKPDLDCVGVDISQGMLDVARQHLPEARLLNAPADQIPVPDGAFNLVTCVTAMHLMPQPLDVFAEFARALAPGGRLVLATFQLPPGRQPVQRTYRTNHTDFETPELVAAAARPAGFTVKRSHLGLYDGDWCLFTELAQGSGQDAAT